MTSGGAASAKPRRNKEEPASLPAYQRILEAIRDRIQAGELKPGARIESERELARLHNVSLMTARHALQELEASGLVTRHIGAGTFVAQPKIHFNKLLGFTEMLAGRGIQAETRLVSLQTVGDNEEVVARLRQPFGSKLIRMERLRLGNGEPFAIETSYLPEDPFARVPRRQFEHRSLFEICHNDFHLTLAHADEEVDATPADPRSAKHLQIATGAPVLRMRQLLYATSGEPILYDIGLYRSDRYSLNIRRYR